MFSFFLFLVIFLIFSSRISLFRAVNFIIRMDLVDYFNKDSAELVDYFNKDSIELVGLLVFR